MSKLWEHGAGASLPAGHAVLPDPQTPHQIPALPRTKQPAAELLQTGHDHEGAARRDRACPELEQRNPAASEQRQVPSVSRDVELLWHPEPPQGEEDGPAAQAQRPQ